MSEDDCRAGDWYGAGLEDGAKGLLDTAFDARAARCTRFGLAADGRAYEEGRSAALSQLCTDAGGYQYGRAGNSYLGVCRPETETAFLSGYLAGKRIQGFEADREAAQTAYDEAVTSLNYHRENLRRARARLDDHDASGEAIKEAQENFDYHNDRLPYAEQKADRALYALGRADEALAAAIATSDDWRRGDAFLTARAILGEAHSFARDEATISYCTDDMPAYVPRCVVGEAAALKDSRSGAICAMGPGEARFARRGPRRVSGQDAGFVQFFDFFPIRGGARPARRASAAFEVLFDASGDYEGLACAAGPAVH